MADKTKISWTDATWNPVTGCTRVSAGCERCYIDWAPPFRIAGRHFTDANGERSNKIGSTTGVLLHFDRFDQPLRWKRGRKIFVNSLSDLFHDEVPDEFIARAFAVMALAPQHTFQVLTKRPARMRALLSSDRFLNQVRLAHVYHAETLPPDHRDLVPVWPLPNVWLGVTVEDQKAADLRIPILRATPAAKRFLSMEPLLSGVDLNSRLGGLACVKDGELAEHHPAEAMADFQAGVDWVICGGESGKDARPMHPDWARAIRDACLSAGVAFWFKQWGEWAPAPWHGEDGASHAFTGTSMKVDGDWVPFFTELDHHPTSIERNAVAPSGAQGMLRVGKRLSGNELDGHVWEQFPQEVAVR